MESDELKEAMKESPKRYTNPFLSDEENEKFDLWNQEHEPSSIKDDLSNNCEDDKLRNSLAPLEYCEKETEVYTDKNVMECDLPELLICYKEGAFHVKDICVDEGIPHGERILFNENNNQILCISSPANDGKHDDMLKPEQLKFSPMEHFYTETNFCSGTNGTDLPVLEPTNDNMDIGNHLDEKKSDPSSGTQDIDADLLVNGPNNDHKDTDNLTTDTQIPVEDFKECGTKEEVIGELREMSKDEDGLLECAPERLKFFSDSDTTVSKASIGELREMSKDENEPLECAPDRLKFFSESDTTVSKTTVPDITGQSDEKQISSSGILLDNTSSTEQLDSNSTPSLQQDQPLLSLKSLLDHIDQQPFQTSVEEMSKRNDKNESTIEGNNTLTLNNDEPAISSGVQKNENPECVQEPSIGPHGAPKLQDVGSDNAAMANPVHRGEGESSFSVACPVSGLITYSGPIAFSGSTSLRSDSSTTSTRSFAFPILQNEWNSSPVRMAKADRRRLQKHRGWRHGLLCCRF